MIQYKAPSSKLEEWTRQSFGTPSNRKEERITQSSSAVINESVDSSPVVTTSSSQSNSLASSRTNVTVANKTNGTSTSSSNIDKINNHDNSIIDDIKSDGSDAAVNGDGDNPGKYVLEPISDDFDSTFAPVNLTNDICVSKSFHTIESFQFTFLVHAKKDGIARIFHIGDHHSGRGFFACCGYHVDDSEQIRLFFSNEQFNKVTSINLKNYLRKDYCSPTQKLDLQVNYISISLC